VELAARVLDNFRISGRGTVQAFEFVLETARFRVGDRVQLKTPHGETYEAVIRGIEHLKKLKPGPGPSWAILLAPPFHDQFFEKDTEIWVFPPTGT
jgi:hypothetical protein